MVHNGIEYGLMAAYAEGLNILHHANAGKRPRTVDAETTPLRHPEHYQYDLNLADVAEIWRRGSVIASWLLDLTAPALLRNPELAGFAAGFRTRARAAGRSWRPSTSRAPAPVISAALYDRFSSRGEADFADKLLSAMRREFGGHAEKAADAKGSPDDCRPLRRAGLLRRHRRSGVQEDLPGPAGAGPATAVSTCPSSAWRRPAGSRALQARAKRQPRRAGGVDPAAFAKLSSLLALFDGDYRDPATFARCGRFSATRGGRCTIWPSRPACSAPSRRAGAGGLHPDARVVVEKPFGRDLASAQELNRTLHRFFPEDAVFRIDHYLGKEPVQNLVYFRFANPLVEASLGQQAHRSVQITMAESFGVAGRGKLYEEVGAIRDVVQNHMLQRDRLPGHGMPRGERSRSPAR